MGTFCVVFHRHHRCFTALLRGVGLASFGWCNLVPGLFIQDEYLRDFPFGVRPFDERLSEVGNPPAENPKPRVSGGMRLGCTYMKGERGGSHVSIRFTSFAKVAVSNSCRKANDSFPILRSRGGSIVSHRQDLCVDEFVFVVEGSRVVSHGTALIGCFLDPFGERGSRFASGGVKMTAKVVVFMDDHQWGLLLFAEVNKRYGVLFRCASSKSPCLGCPDNSTEAVEISAYCEQGCNRGSACKCSNGDGGEIVGKRPWDGSLHSHEFGPWCDGHGQEPRREGAALWY